MSLLLPCSFLCSFPLLPACVCVLDNPLMFPSLCLSSFVFYPYSSGMAALKILTIIWITLSLTLVTKTPTNREWQPNSSTLVQATPPGALTSNYTHRCRVTIGTAHCKVVRDTMRKNRHLAQTHDLQRHIDTHRYTLPTDAAHLRVMQHIATEQRRELDDTTVPHTPFQAMHIRRIIDHVIADIQLQEAELRQQRYTPMTPPHHITMTYTRDKNGPRTNNLCPGRGWEPLVSLAIISLVSLIAAVIASFCIASLMLVVHLLLAHFQTVRTN